MLEIQVTKEVLQITDRGLGKANLDSFVRECQKTPDSPALNKEKISIREAELRSLDVIDTKLLKISDELSFSIANEDVAKIINQIIQLVKNPLTVMTLLKGLDTALGNIMAEHAIHFTEEDLPQFLITGKGHYIPGPAPEDYRPRTKARLLDQLLLECELAHGINTEGSTPKFIGFVDAKKADPFIASGHLFSENKQISRILLHGSYSHRLMFYALWQAIEKDILDLKYGDDNELTSQQLLELLIYNKYYIRYQDFVLDRNSVSLWTVIVDTVVDTYNLTDSGMFNFSCRSPFVFNSLLLCFGQELDLPNLQHYLLDSHWKAAYQMVNRVKAALPQNSETSNGVIYVLCMEAMSTTEGNPGEIGVKLPFTLSDDEALTDPRYSAYSSECGTGIAKKSDDLDPEKEAYASWDDYLDRKTAKTSKASSSSKVQSLPREIDYVEQLKAMVKQTEGTSVDINIENVLDKFVNCEKYLEFEILLADLDPREQKILLRLLGPSRLINLVNYSFRMTNILKRLSTSNQELLITLLGSEHLKQIINTYNTLIDILIFLQSESRTILLNQLGKTRILNLFPLLSFLVEGMRTVITNDKIEIAVDLLDFFSDNPIIDIMQSRKDYKGNPYQYHCFEAWHGVYNAESFVTYMNELEELMSSGVNHVVQISTVDSTPIIRINFTYDKKDGWSLISKDYPYIAISSIDTASAAAEIFILVANRNEAIKLSTQFSVQSDYLKSDYHKLEERQQRIADDQCFNQLSFLAEDDSAERYILLRQAFANNSIDLCIRLINTGLDFYTCGIAKNASYHGTFNDELYATLCEEQAKFNIDKLRATIFDTDWKIKIGGKKITNAARSQNTKVPTTVKSEWLEIVAAENRNKTYYSAWKNIIALRIGAATHNNDWAKFFRTAPAKAHYLSADNEASILSLRNRK